MRTIDSDFNISSSKLKLVEVYKIERVDGTIYYYTSFDKDIAWGTPSITYTAIPISRRAINREMNLEPDQVDVQMGMPSGIVADVAAGLFDGAIVTIKMIPYSAVAADGAEMIVFQGIAQVMYNQYSMILICVSTPLNSLNMLVPRNLYQAACNYRLFDTGCDVTKADYLISGTTDNDGGDAWTVDLEPDSIVHKTAFDDATGTLEVGDVVTGSLSGESGKIIIIRYVTATTGFIYTYEMTLDSGGNGFDEDDVLIGDGSGAQSVTANGASAVDLTFFDLGEIKITSGDANGQRRMVRNQIGDELSVAVGFSTEILNGMTYELHPGCYKTAEHCDLKFNNVSRFGGFKYIPKPEEALYGEVE